MEDKRIALIPAYEPDERLLIVLQDLLEHGYEIVIVNDGSNAMWEDLFQTAEAFGRVLAHERNQGKGAALKTGLVYIRDNYGENCTVVTVDADGQHVISDIENVCHMAACHADALVLGSRSFSEGTPARSKFGNTVTHWVYRMFTGQDIKDTQTGLRAFSASLIPVMLKIEGARYEYEMNVLMQCARNHIQMIEVPIRTIYLEGNASSHFDTLKDSARIYREITKFFASSFLSFLLDYSVFTLLVLLFGRIAAGGIATANVIARLISGTFNFTLNRRVVFESNTKLSEAAVRYIALAGTVLAAGTGSLWILTKKLGVNALIAKLIVEVCLFLFNFIIQRTIVFPGEERTHRKLKTKLRAVSI